MFAPHSRGADSERGGRGVVAAAAAAAVGFSRVSGARLVRSGAKRMRQWKTKGAGGGCHHTDLFPALGVGAAGWDGSRVDAICRRKNKEKYAGAVGAKKNTKRPSGKKNLKESGSQLKKKSVILLKNRIVTGLFICDP